MSTTLIEVRRAKASDACAIASTHDEAWRAAYQGIIPGTDLHKLINRRGPGWWQSAIRKGSRIALLQFGDKVAGYANYGRNRARSLRPFLAFSRFLRATSSRRRARERRAVNR